MVYMVRYGMVYANNFTGVEDLRTETLSISRGGCISLAEQFEETKVSQNYTRMRLTSFDIKERGC